MSSASATPHLLVFEPDGRGHAREWLEHLIGWLNRSRRGGDLSIVTDPALAAELAAQAVGHGESRVRVAGLSRTEAKLCNSSRLAISGLARWWTMNRYLRITGATHGLFLGIDHLSLPLGLGLSARRRPVSGILFRPSVHYDPGADPPWRERLRDLRKDILYRGMLRNRAVRTVWSLDPDFPAFAVERYTHGDKVRPIPDPVCPVRGGASTAVAFAKPAAAEGRTTFLLFGVLAERKGVFRLIDALSRIETAYARSMHIVFAGSIDPRIRKPFYEAVDRLREERPELLIYIDERRLPDGDLAAYVGDADVILAPYQRFAGSSGVLLWAAAAGKPVITQSYGLLGRLVDEFGLGIAVDTTDASDLASALISTVRDGTDGLCDTAGLSRYVESHSPAIFAARIMEDVFGFSFDDPVCVNPAGNCAASTD